MYNNVQKIKEKGKEGRKVGLVTESESSVYKLIGKQTEKKKLDTPCDFAIPAPSQH